jgi:hypothetical protein
MRVRDALPFLLAAACVLIDFLCLDPPSNLCSTGLNPGQCEEQGGHGHCFASTLKLKVDGTGSLAGFNRTLWVLLEIEVHTDPRNPGDPVQAFETDMYRMQGELFGDPDFCTFRLLGGTDYGLPSPGETTLTDLDNGTFNVESFFDITHQIEFEDCPSSQIEDYMGTTTATLRMETGVPVPEPSQGVLAVTAVSALLALLAVRRKPRVAASLLFAACVLIVPVSSSAGVNGHSDTDGDHVIDEDDNCTFTPNTNQNDVDQDGRGDACECGDFSGDGRVNTTDARLIQRCAVGQIPCATLCDVTNDGQCNTTDARIIQRFAVGQFGKDALRCVEVLGSP